MFCKNKKYISGFIFIELLIVIAIIGVLVSYILASMSEARRKGRDTQRISDIRELRSALELYFEANKTYPLGLGVCDPANNLFFGLEALTPDYISAISKDPLGGDCLVYATPTNSGTQLVYHLGISLEQSTNIAFDADANCYSSAIGGAPRGQCPGWVAGGFLGGFAFDGDSAGKCRVQHGGSFCYDRTPE